MQKIERFSIVRVATKDIVTDAFQGIRNFFGLRLRGYEKMLRKNIKEVTEEAQEKYDIIWHRLIVNPMGSNSAMIIIYGDGMRK